MDRASVDIAMEKVLFVNLDKLLHVLHVMEMVNVNIAMALVDVLTVMGRGNDKLLS